MMYRRIRNGAKDLRRGNPPTSPHHLRKVEDSKCRQAREHRWGRVAAGGDGVDEAACPEGIDARHRAAVEAGTEIGVTEEAHLPTTAQRPLQAVDILMMNATATETVRNHVILISHRNNVH